MATMFGTLVAVVLTGPTPVSAQDAASNAPKAAVDEPVPKFDAAYTSDADNIKVGQAVWAKQCRHCHGKQRLPWQGAKPSPGGMEPVFFSDRHRQLDRAVWSAVFTLEERKAVTAYIILACCVSWV